MFFNRLIRNLVVISLLFVLALNIYHWSMQLEVNGNADNFRYVGFYVFNEQLSRFPHFEYFRESIDEVYAWISYLSTTDWNIVLGVITAGLSYLVQVTYLLVKMFICVVADLFTILFWLLDFFTLNVV